MMLLFGIAGSLLFTYSQLDPYCIAACAIDVFIEYAFKTFKTTTLYSRLRSLHHFLLRLRISSSLKSSSEYSVKERYEFLYKSV